MAVRLRLALFGKKHSPVFRIVAMDSRKMRDGKCLDNLGTYNPVTGEFVQFHIDRIDEWLKKGAVPSDPVKKLYKSYKKSTKTKVEEKPAEATEVKVAPKKAAPKKEVVEAKETKKADVAPAVAPKKDAPASEKKEEKASAATKETK